MVDRCEILGVPFDQLSREELISTLDGMLSGDSQGYVVTPNPEILMYARRDNDYREVLNRAALSIADGVGIIWASRLLGQNIKERIPGVEIGEQVLAMCADKGRGVFLLGAADGVAQAAAENMKAKYPGLAVLGVQHGYFDDSENERVINNINESGAEVLFVCMGFPRQEKWIAKNIASIPRIKAAFALGGSLDVYSGRVKRAPRIVCKLGLEWLWRAFSSFSHFRRVIKLPIYIITVLRNKRRAKHV